MYLGITYPVGKTVNYETPGIFTKGVSDPIYNYAPFQKYLEDTTDGPKLTKKKSSRKSKKDAEMEDDSGQASGGLFGNTSGGGLFGNKSGGGLFGSTFGRSGGLFNKKSTGFARAATKSRASLFGGPNIFGGNNSNNEIKDPNKVISLGDKPKAFPVFPNEVTAATRQQIGTNIGNLYCNNYNTEYIIYDEALVRIRYIVQLTVDQNNGYF